jgi:hypothetical protein
VNTDAHDIAGRDIVEIQLNECFVYKMRRTVLSRGCRRQDIQPAGSNNGDAE